MTRTTRPLLAGLALAALVAATPALAAETSIWAVGVSGGTLGFGPELAYRFGPHLGVRANAGLFSYGTNDTYDSIAYNVDLKLNSIGGLLDWYPFGGGFRLSAGARLNNNEVRLAGTPATAVQIGPTTYTPAQVGTLTGTITGQDLAPTLTLGYGGQLAKGFTMGVEVGAMLQGSPKLQNLQASGLLAQNPSLQTDLKAEALAIENDASQFKIWPVLQLHVLYRF